jgi:hypothetical protein
VNPILHEVGSTSARTAGADSCLGDFHLGSQPTKVAPSLRTWLNSRKAIQLRAISAGPAPAETEFCVDELPLAALEEADVFICPPHSGALQRIDFNDVLD